MVDFNELRNKAQSLVSEHSTQVKSGIDKVGEVIGGKVGHDRTDPIEKKLHGLVDRLKGHPDPAAETMTGSAGPVGPDAPVAPSAAQPTPASPGPEPTVPDPGPTPPNPGPTPSTPTPASTPHPAEPSLPEQPGAKIIR